VFINPIELGPDSFRNFIIRGAIDINKINSTTIIQTVNPNIIDNSVVEYGETGDVIITILVVMIN
jgi:hypothetical protein